MIAALAPRAFAVFERNVRVYRRQWLMIVTGFFEPLFFLLGIGFGVGGVIGTLTYNGVEVPYAAFVAPALLASSAMNGAIFDSTFNVFYKLKYAKVYDAILTTPVSIGDLAVGELLWSNLRGVIYSIAFLAVLAAALFVFGAVKPWAQAATAGALAPPCAASRPLLCLLSAAFTSSTSAAPAGAGTPTKNSDCQGALVSRSSHSVRMTWTERRATSRISRGKPPTTSANGRMRLRSTSP